VQPASNTLPQNRESSRQQHTPPLSQPAQENSTDHKPSPSTEESKTNEMQPAQAVTSTTTPAQLIPAEHLSAENHLQQTTPNGPKKANQGTRTEEAQASMQEAQIEPALRQANNSM